MTEMQIAGVFADSRRQYPVIVLYEQGGCRVVPIWVGISEGHSLQVSLGEIECARPLTHELTSRVLDAVGGELVRVLIADYQDRTYHARVVLQGADEALTTIDARASDAIALAAREHCPILVSDSVPQPEIEDLVDMSEKDRHRAITALLRRIHPQDLGRFGHR